MQRKDSGLECKVLEDKEIKFDVPNLHKNLREGENILITVEYIEDTKGNVGDTGKLLATNLRLIWHSLVHKKFNLSVGYSRILTLTTKTVFSKARGTTLALFVLAVGTNTRFEFLFTDVSSESRSNSIFASVFDIYRIYQQTYLYRELKLRGAILQSGQLIILPQEQVYSSINGVWNLSSDQGNLGSFIITNIRIVWYADINETFNLSLPYVQIATIKVRESKYGTVLVIQTTDTGGGYVLGFRIDPQERLNSIYKELTSLHAVYSETPNFGVYYTADDINNSQAQNIPSISEEFEEIDERQEKEINSKLIAYLAEGTTGREEQREPFYCKELGFAMEKIRDGFKLSDLWNVIPTSSE